MPKLLIDGFKKFLSDHYDSTSALMPKLAAEGQNPDYFIISCIDSRSNAGTVFQTPPGAFFSHKAMGAIVRPYRQGTALAAALQFALDYNKVKTIIILGHTGCGAVKALIDDLDDPEIKSFVSVAQEGLHRAQEACNHDSELQRKAEEEILRLSYENIQHYPSVARALKDNRIILKAWLFDMAGGALFEYEPDTHHFTPIIQRTDNA